MMIQIVRSCCPIVREEVMNLWDSVNVAGRCRMIAFEKPILWLRRSEAKVVLRHDGLDVKDICTLNDWYGFLTSVEHAIKRECPKISEAYKIGTGDRLSIDVDVEITDTPVLKDESEEAKEDARRYAGQRYRKSYVAVPSRMWFTEESYDVNSGKELPLLTEKTVVVWKSIYASSRDGVGIPPGVTAFIESKRKEVDAS